MLPLSSLLLLIAARSTGTLCRYLHCLIPCRRLPKTYPPVIFNIFIITNFLPLYFTLRFWSKLPTEISDDVISTPTSGLSGPVSTSDFPSSGCSTNVVFVTVLDSFRSLTPHVPIVNSVLPFRTFEVIGDF